MSLDAVLRPKGWRNAAVNLQWLQEQAGRRGLQVGDWDETCVLQPYAGGPNILRHLFVLYNAQHPGTGIRCIWETRRRLSLNVSTLTVPEDVTHFFALIKTMCETLGLQQFTLDGALCRLSQLETLQAGKRAFCQGALKATLPPGTNAAGVIQPMTVFGAIWPVTLEETLLRRLQPLSPADTWKAYAAYLNEKQRVDCYHARPVAGTSVNGTVTACSLLMTGIPTIFPLRPYLPYRWPARKQQAPAIYSVVLTNSQTSQILARLPFAEFCQKADPESYPPF